VVVLGQARHRAPAVQADPQLGDPVGEDVLDFVLPQRQTVGVPRRKVADIQPNLGEAGYLSDLAARQEAYADSPRIERLAGARGPTPRPPTARALTDLQLDDGDAGFLHLQFAPQ